MRPSSIAINHYVVDSAVLKNTRSVWIQPPAGDASEAGLAIFLDGEYYLTHFQAPAVMKSLQDERFIPPTWCVFVDARERTVRWPETLCNADFATFVCDELMPQIQAVTGACGDRMLAGISLTGLCAAFIALSRPGHFNRVLCQTGSFWWERGSLARRVGEWGRNDALFRVTVGRDETATDVDHGHGLIQVDSQLDGCRQMRDALVNHGCRVSYAEHAGGHDIASIRAQMPTDLRALYAAE